MDNSKVNPTKNQLPPELITLTEASKYLKLQEKQLRDLISRKNITQGVYNLSYKNKRINLEEFLDNFKPTKEVKNGSVKHRNLQIL